MTSDVFGSFLTYLPTLIRYRQMWLDLPTYPKIWCQILKISRTMKICIFFKFLWLLCAKKWKNFLRIQTFLQIETVIVNDSDKSKVFVLKWLLYIMCPWSSLCPWVGIWAIASHFKKQNFKNGSSDVRSSLTYPPTFIRYHQM